MFEILLLFIPILIGIGLIAAFIYFSTRTGEDCPDYPHKCPYCHKSTRCITEIGRKDK